MEGGGMIWALARCEGLLSPLSIGGASGNWRLVYFQIFCKIGIIALLFVFDKYCSIID